MKRFILFTVSLLCVVFLAHMAIGQIVKKKAVQDSRYLQYEGVLTDPSGEKVTGEYTVTFTMYDSTDAAVPQWIEVHDVSVNEGEFTVTLGRNTPLPSIDMDNAYIGVSIAGEELLPRQVVRSSRIEEDTSMREFPKSKEPFYLWDDDWNFWDNPPHMFSVAEGNVGIGTTDPTSKLEVNGTVTMNDIKLTSDSMRVVNIRVDTLFLSNPDVGYPGHFFITVDTSTWHGTVMNESLYWGYNPGATIPNTHALWYNIETNYWNGTDSLMEVNLNYYSADFTFKRPYQLEIDRQTDFVEQIFYSDDFRIIGGRFAYYPDETTGNGHVGFYNTDVLISDTASWGGLRMHNREGSGVKWGMHVEDETQNWWLGLPEKTTKFVEIDTMGYVAMSRSLMIDSSLTAEGGLFVDDEGDSVFVNTSPDRGVKIVYADSNGYVLDIRSDADAGIRLDINGSASSGLFLPFDPTVAGGNDYFGMNMRISDGTGANFKAHGIKISGSSFDSPDEHLLELYDADSDGLWGINIDRITHDLRYYYNDALVIRFDTLGLDSTSIADGSLITADLKDSLITGAKIGSGVVQSSHLADSLEWFSSRYVADSLHYWDVSVNGIGYDFQFVYNEQDTFTVDTTGVIDGTEILSTSAIDIDSLNADHLVVNATLQIPTYTDTITGTADTLFIHGMTAEGLIALTFLEDFTSYFCVYTSDMVIVHSSAALSAAPYRYGVLAY